MIEHPDVYNKMERSILPSRWVAISAVMTALTLIGSYSTVGIPNVELASTILFLTAFIFGLKMGVWCTVISSLIYSMFNPWGPLIPQIWLTQVLGWFCIVIVGAILGETGPEIRILKPSRSNILTFFALVGLAFIGGMMTVFFDLLTTLGYSWATGVPFWVNLAPLVPFMIIHVTSNTILFPIVVPTLELTLKREFGNEIWTPINLSLSEE